MTNKATALRIAGILDEIIIGLLLGFTVHFLVMGEVEKALLCFIAAGVWCCSVSLQKILERKE